MANAIVYIAKNSYLRDIKHAKNSHFACLYNPSIR